MFDPQAFVGLQDVSSNTASRGCSCGCSGGAGAGAGSGIDDSEPVTAG